MYAMFAQRCVEICKRERDITYVYISEREKAQINLIDVQRIENKIN